MTKSGGIQVGTIIVKVDQWQIAAIFFGASVAEIRDFVNADGRVQISSDTEPFVLTSDRADAAWQAEPGNEEEGVLKLPVSKKMLRLRGFGKIVSEDYVIRPTDFFLWFRPKS